MGNAYFMGIDTGTNSSKGVLMDESGKVVALHATTHAMTNPKPNHYEHDAEKDWWGDFCTISKALIEKSGVDPKDIKAVGASALGADCLPVDKAISRRIFWLLTVVFICFFICLNSS